MEACVKKRGQTGLFLLLCLTAVLLCGCGKTQGQGEAEKDAIVKNPYAGAVSMESTPVIDYTVPRLLPNILVDTGGYSAADGKTAAVKGRELPEEFRLVDVLTGEEVYRGAVEEIVRHDEMGIYSGRLDFSDFQQAGSYYLECGIIGCSLPFDIREKHYTALFEDIHRELTDSIRDRSVTLQEAVDLLAAYEWYGEIFPDGDSEEGPEVLKELRGWVSYMEENGVEEEDEALYAAFLAKFSYNYQKIDRGYATNCLKRASTVFGQVRTAVSRDSDTFFALVELYRATGRYAYRQQVAGYKDFFEDNSSYMEERSYLYAAMTYMDTKQRGVDRELCKHFMDDLMARAEEISRHCADMTDAVAAKNDGQADLLKGAVRLSCANYIENNYLYTEGMEDFLHYLMGRNRESVCFYEDGEDRGSYLLLFAQLAALHEAEM